jgi:hypothetical protein
MARLLAPKFFRRSRTDHGGSDSRWRLGGATARSRRSCSCPSGGNVVNFTRLADVASIRQFIADEGWLKRPELPWWAPDGHDFAKEH